jgi:hypothetical protein
MRGLREATVHPVIGQKHLRGQPTGDHSTRFVVDLRPIQFGLGGENVQGAFSRRAA